MMTESTTSSSMDVSFLAGDLRGSLAPLAFVPFLMAFGPTAANAEGVPAVVIESQAEVGTNWAGELDWYITDHQFVEELMLLHDQMIEDPYELDADSTRLLYENLWDLYD